jgi:threonine synthase
MRLESTRRQSPAVSFREALVRGLAPDGGLYLPAAWPRISIENLRAWRGEPFADLAVRLAGRLLADEFAPDVIERLVRDALDFPVPLVEVAPARFVLELFHGPTLAFKDFGARFLARFFGHLLEERHGRATILVATSGDTGSAVAQAFFGVPRVDVVVVYPAGRVSPFQEAQLATFGGNIRAVRLPGTFDDCQRLVKQAFLDPDLGHLGLSSANSINIGRLLPQAFYYVAGYLAAVSKVGDEVIFSVPTGNVGNLTAGVIARALGVPVARFVAATNANRVLPDFLDSGTYRARPSVATLSNAMDVGDPSNFSRLLALHDGSIDRLRAGLYSVSIDEEETRATIRRVYARHAYALDPHTAVAWAAGDRYVDFAADRVAPAERRTTPHMPLVTLATAHPAKFASAIAEELGFAPSLPSAYDDWQQRPLRAVDLDTTDGSSFRTWLLSVLAP